MEIKFSQQSVRCLRTLTSQYQQREEVLEVRLPDGMPDIGRVLGCWGQVVVRGKEWRSGGMHVSGGVMAWALYAPEDGSQPQSVEAWIPFQQKWEFDDGGRDGFICAIPLVKSMDARSVSARKMMLRANISTWGKALQTADEALFAPEALPEDVQLLRQAYPMELPMEFGERLLQLDEELTLPAAYPSVEKILRYELIPRVTEHKVMTSRLVFRGVGKLRLLYLSDGKVNSWETEIPFSQYADLDRDYGSSASAKIMPVVTNLEVDRVDDRLQMKASLAVQFTVYERAMVEVVADAYSPVRTVSAQSQELRLPMQLDQWVQSAQVCGSIRTEIGSVVDIGSMMDHPLRRQNGDCAQLDLSGSFQVLYYDAEGNLHAATARYEMPVDVASSGSSAVEGIVVNWGLPELESEGDGVKITQELQMDICVHGGEGLAMITGLTLGEEQAPDAGRPSIILRRCEDGSLWKLAKDSGSTVEAIRKANDLEGEPQTGRLLLIPVS